MSNYSCIRLRWLLLSFAFLLLAGCRNNNRVVVYCAHDREFAEAILHDFEKETGIKVEAKWDTESTKSVGLYEDLIREASHPRCDVHWNNEILATIRLQQKGVLQPYASPSAVPFPEEYKAADQTWTAFAARARVLLVNTDKVKKDEMPKSILDLLDPRWKGQVAMAKPLFGTTATQAACLFQAWGNDKASEFYRKLKANDVQIVAGNKQSAVSVGQGQFAIGMTDTDDAAAEIEAGRPVAMVFPDGDARPVRAGSHDPAPPLKWHGPETVPQQRGVLFIPNTVAMVKGCPNPDGAKKLIDFLLRPEVEIKLAKSESRQIPLNPQVQLDSIKYVQTPRMVHAMPVDFVKAAASWTESQEFLVKEFGLR